ncbi:hypothetical protein [Novosphingobium album (ex Liu et al. 2023)]|uniref:Aminotransferase class V-fold PLP-dependent enzyme n=1 Tax=Novosphingobium album (ex Liu et al. 2023) TaxID=3031130 RepID=A0ABT5WLI5_9SPHN|nr:hypothetical protein [Novosphingobium album (ex Liu et al. 2023)]MDE8650897.1 hypothetical protein [Novosphingobium album (ex Liu et al. 2023)]
MSCAQFLSPMLASGGDRRITVPNGGNTNVYGASPFPRAVIGYASSTANDISLDAFRHLERLVADWPVHGLQDPAAYAAALERMRHRLRGLWGLTADTGVVFAPSGTDLEYVGLALAGNGAGAPVTNIVLGPDEVGSGCLLAAGGCYFSGETALAGAIRKGAGIAGFEAVEVAALPLRGAGSTALASDAVAAALDTAIATARRQGRKVVAHAVHGSKTGLILPDLAAIDGLLARHGDDLTLAVDACQARIEPAEIRGYLDRGCVVFLTGSKFIGGPPFSGMALVPPGRRPAAMLARGLATVFRRAEWPAEWREADLLPAGANPGLLLRLEAALFELERFAAIGAGRRDAVIAAFGVAVRALARRIDAGLVAPALAPGGLHTATLATIDLSAMPGGASFATAQRWQKVLAARGLRLGQPVRCLRDASGDWAGTLRISLSMPMIVARAGLAPDALAAGFAADMARIAAVIEAARRRVA